jgi:transcription-repair coupling factor (superfamily II helicase)
MHAIFRVVQAGRQVFVLCPTTILAKQHAALMRKRLEPFGHSVGLLTRYRDQNGPTRVGLLQEISEHAVDVVVGTQALLSATVDYSHVSLLVIDEEQRFGVQQKEAITALKSKVDVLTMTATPIPRTMHMAVSGVRDTSLLTTPPPQRRPIQTVLKPLDDEVVKEAIQEEIARKGQVFYVIPRVQQIKGVKDRLEALLPGIRVAKVLYLPKP